MVCCSLDSICVCSIIKQADNTRITEGVELHGVREVALLTHFVPRLAVHAGTDRLFAGQVAVTDEVIILVRSLDVTSKYLNQFVAQHGFTRVLCLGYTAIQVNYLVLQINVAHAQFADFGRTDQRLEHQLTDEQITRIIIHKPFTHDSTCVCVNYGTLLGFFLLLGNTVEWVLLDKLLLHAPSKECLGAHKVIVKGGIYPIVLLALLVQIADSHYIREVL